MAHEANNGAKREVMDAVFEMPATEATAAGRSKATGGADSVAKEAENGRRHPGRAVRAEDLKDALDPGSPAPFVRHQIGPMIGAVTNMVEGFLSKGGPEEGGHPFLPTQTGRRKNNRSR